MNREKTFLYTVCRGIAAFIYRIIFPTKMIGKEHYPKDQNFIVLSNHLSAWDPITIAMTYKDSEIHFMAKDSLFRNKLLAALLRKLHAFSVNRGESDMAAMRTAMKVIKDGHVLGIFPEGTRQQNNRVQSIETGIAVMALKTDVPLVPVIITGQYKLFSGLKVAIGEPIALDDLRAARHDSDALEALKRRVIDSLEALRPVAEAL